MNVEIIMYIVLNKVKKRFIFLFMVYFSIIMRGVINSVIWIDELMVILIVRFILFLRVIVIVVKCFVVLLIIGSRISLINVFDKFVLDVKSGVMVEIMNFVWREINVVEMSRIRMGG